MNDRGEIIIYQTPDGCTSIDVKLENETVWLNQSQMAELFQKNRTVIGRHVSNIFREGELEEKSNVHFLHIPLSDKPVAFYNLDVIISVGYRVKSQRGIQFRVWANKVLKDYLIQGYAVRDNLRLENYQNLKELVRLAGRTIDANQLEASDETQGLFDVVIDYSYALDTLDNYDYQKLTIDESDTEEKYKATYEGSIEVINRLKSKFGGSELFGRPKDKSFESSIGQIYQTFDGKELYPSVEQKAAMLLYLVVKNHSFVDGNKRIAATLFLWFMDRNRILYNLDHTKRIADNTLVAMTLMIAESKMEEMEMMVKVVVNLING